VNDEIFLFLHSKHYSQGLTLTIKPLKTSQNLTNLTNILKRSNLKVYEVSLTVFLMGIAGNVFIDIP